MTKENNEDSLKLIVSPTFRVYHPQDYGIYSAELAGDTDDSSKVEYNDYGNMTIKGNLPKLDLGKKYRVTVVPEEDKKYGLGYKVLSIYEDTPTTKDEQISFFKAILTEKQVEEIFKVYPDEDVIKLISEDKFDYSKVKGIGKVIYESVKKKVLNNMEYREAIIVLTEEYGVTPVMVKRMSDHYGSPKLLVQKIEENPYILSYEVNGMGFKKCDDIALRQGIAEDSPKRIGACVLFILNREADNGHIWLSKNKLSAEVSKDLGIRMSKVTAFIDGKDDENIGSRIYNGKTRIALKENYEAEKTISKHIKRLLGVENNYHVTNVDGTIYEIEQKQGFEFTKEQRDAIYTAIEKNVLVINGYAGTGKTSLLKGIIEVLQTQEDLKYATCALSGKASQRIQQATGLMSSTMHRLLGYNPTTGFQADEFNPLDIDVIVLDEASMVNSYLMSMLIRAIKDGAKIIIVGDSAQLEAIGAGNVLKDLIESGVVPRVELTEVHRQAQKSGILSNANKVREGIQFAKQGDYKSRRLGELKDLWFYPYKQKESVLKRVLELAEKFKGQNIFDFQVLSPLKTRGDLSVKNLNKELQEIFNPDEIGKSKLTRGEIEFRTGDKIIQNHNNYDAGVFNGTLGLIEYVDMKKKLMVIDFEDVGRIEYTSDDLNQIDLAYALTAHKSQGSQFKFVVLAFDYSSFILLSRQLLYTALTRAENTMFLVVELSALLQAVRTDNATHRNTFLQEMLAEDIEEVS